MAEEEIIIYHLFVNSVVITKKNQCWTISRDDPRFAAIVLAISSGNLAQAAALADNFSSTEMRKLLDFLD